MKKLFSLLIIISFLVISTGNSFAQERASGSSAKIHEIININSDYRVRVLKSFLKSYNSPLVPYAGTFIKYADQYDLDWRLVASISGLESTFGQQIPYGTYNGWGWGIYGTNMIWFTSWEDGIKTVSQGLRENYINKWGATNVYEIGRFYASSPTWASRVDYLMGRIAQYSLNNPQDALSLAL